MQGTGDSSGKDGIFDKKRLYPKELRETTSFKSWSDRFLSWLSMDDQNVGQAFLRAGKQPEKIEESGLDSRQTAYSHAVYGHLRSLTEGYKKASTIVRLVKGDNGLEAWRRLVRKFDPQNPEVHQATLSNIITYGVKYKTEKIGEVPTVLDKFERVLDDYEEATGEPAVNDATRKTIMMQLLPKKLQQTTRDTLMAAMRVGTSHASVTASYLATIIIQRCEYDDGDVVVPMDAGAADEEEDAGSMGQRAVGPGAGKGGGKGGGKNSWAAPLPPTCEKLPPGGHAWMGQV